jgi:hypothetical protein
MKKIKWTNEQIEQLKRDYATTLAHDLSVRFGCSKIAIYAQAQKLGLSKDKEFMRDHFRQKILDPAHPARKFCIKAGSVPPNKGKKQTEYMSPGAIARTAATRFEKGHLPKNTLHDHAVTIRVDSKGNSYKWIRLGLAKWVPYHRYLWEQHNGPIPKGYTIQFKDGNTLNCEDINNLYMISRSEQLKTENSFYARYPEEVQQLIHLKGALNRQINNAIKKNENGTD